MIFRVSQAEDTAIFGILLFLAMVHAVMQGRYFPSRGLADVFFQFRRYFRGGFDDDFLRLVAEKSQLTFCDADFHLIEPLSQVTDCLSKLGGDFHGSGTA